MPLLGEGYGPLVPPLATPVVIDILIVTASISKLFEFLAVY